MRWTRRWNPTYESRGMSEICRASASGAWGGRARCGGCDGHRKSELGAGGVQQRDTNGKDTAEPEERVDEGCPVECQGGPGVSAYMQQLRGAIVNSPGSLSPDTGDCKRKETTKGENEEVRRERRGANAEQARAPRIRRAQRRKQRAGDPR